MPNEKITSLQNPFIKKVVELRESKTRRELKVILIDGIREMTMALEAGVKLERVYYCLKFLNQKTSVSLLKRLSDDGIETFETSEAVFQKIAFGERQEGLVALAQMPEDKLSDWPKIQNPLYVVLETLEKPGNLGAILRTAEAVGLSGVIVCEKKTDIYNPNVIRSSLGAVFSVPIVASSNQECLEFLHSRQVTIFATLPEAKKVFTQSVLSKSAAIVLGSEQEGLSDFWKQHANEQIKIPLLGKVNSLNVSVAAAVVVYEALRQRT